MLDRDLLSGLMIQVDFFIVLLFQQFVSGLILLYIVVRNDRLLSFSRWLRAALDCRCPWLLHDRARTIHVDDSLPGFPRTVTAYIPSCSFKTRKTLLGPEIWVSRITLVWTG